MQKSLHTILLITCCLLISNTQAQQPPRLTKKFFPDFNITLHSPAFQKQDGVTRYDEMMQFLNRIRIGYESICSINMIGKSQKGIEIPMVVLHKPTGGDNKPRVVIQARLHGDEPASTEGALHLLYMLLNDPPTRGLLEQLEIAIIPMANIDGAEKMQRTAANGLDLNRDQTKLEAPETILLKKAINDFNPDVFIDLHEFNPTRNDFGRMGSFGVTNYFDAMFLFSSNRNVPDPLRALTQDVFVKNAASLFEENGLRSHTYFTTSRSRGQVYFNLGGTSARSSSTSYALTNAVSILMEIRGVNLRRTALNRRTYTTYLAALSYLRTAAANAETLKNTILTSINNRSDIVITRTAPIDSLTIPFIDFQKNAIVNEKVWIRNAVNNKPGITRSWPSAYLISKDQQAVITKLLQLGLELDSLDKSTEMEVEQFSIRSYRLSNEAFEGRYEQIVRARTQKKKITFPAGTRIVRMNQRRAGLAAVTLEPEAENGFVRYQVLKTAKGAVLPIYRVIR